MSWPAGEIRQLSLDVIGEQYHRYRLAVAEDEPKTPLDTLADDERRHVRGLLDDTPVRPRPTGEYEQLFSKDPPDDGDTQAEPTRPS